MTRRMRARAALTLGIALCGGAGASAEERIMRLSLDR